jgi:pyruvate-ferredoxin/flavodoxin oxidoreductase
MSGRINTIMQTAFFKISGVLPEVEALKLIKKYTEKTYARKGADVVARNIEAIDMAGSNIHEVKIGAADSKKTMIAPVTDNAPTFVKEVIGEIIATRGDKIPVSALPDDGTFPSGTTRYEKRNIAEKIPVWEPDLCIQCAQCNLVCPHAVIRIKVYQPELLAKAPATFKSADPKPFFKEFPGQKVTIQVSPEDCTGCGLCIASCPAKDKANPSRKAINFGVQSELRVAEAANWDFFMSLPNPDVTKVNPASIVGTQIRQPLFEFSGACAGCGETPYIKLMSQLFGDHAVIANATGCSSIYGGNLPTTPWSRRDDGKGPSWANSLFEDAAEFGYGMSLTVEKTSAFAREMLGEYKGKGVPSALADRIMGNPQSSDALIEEQRSNVAELKKELAKVKEGWAANLASVADEGFVKKSVWIIGGDGWAYDIGFGGLDHVIASGRNVNILVLDTELYSNTGGQASKATPFGSIAKFATSGKDIGKKDLGMIAMSYGYVYVAQVALGANYLQVIKAFREAEAYDGPSIIIAYSHCINHGIDMQKGLSQQKTMVESGTWPLFRYDPRLVAEGKNPFQLDSKEPQSEKIPEYMYNEVRFKSLRDSNPERAAMLIEKQKTMVARRWREYKYLADRTF